MWFDPRVALSYNCLFNFILGARSGGKTFSSILYGIQKHKESWAEGQPYEIAYVRRYKNDAKISREKFFNALIAEGKLPPDSTKIKGNVGYIDNKPFVNFMTLSTFASSAKSAAFPNVRLIIFDEFLINKKMSRYLPDEVETFLELYVTIARGRDVPVLFLANSVSQINPYFTYFHITMRDEKIFTVRTPGGERLLVQMWEDKEFYDSRKQSRFAKLISGTNYSSYAIDNEFWLDSTTFIERREATAKHICTFIYKGKRYGVWRSYRAGKVWIDERAAPPSQFEYCFSTDDMQPNLLFAKAFKRTYHFKLVSDAAKIGALYFDSLNTKEVWYSISAMVMI